MVSLGEGDIAQAEQHEGDETWEAEGAIERQAFLQEAPGRRVVVVEIGRDHAEVVQRGGGNEGVPGPSGECQSLFQQGPRCRVFLLEPCHEPG